MDDLLVVKHEYKHSVKYPDIEYKGNASKEGFYVNPTGFAFETDLCRTESVELIQKPLFWLRGIIVEDNQKYVFSAQVCLDNFGKEDYEELLVQALEKIKFLKEAAYNG